MDKDIKNYRNTRLKKLFGKQLCNDQRHKHFTGQAANGCSKEEGTMYTNVTNGIDVSFSMGKQRIHDASSQNLTPECSSRVICTTLLSLILLQLDWILIKSHLNPISSLRQQGVSM